MRRLALSDKRERGIPRKLRQLKRWSESFKDNFPDLDGYDDKFYNWKIPVPLNMIQGKHAEQGVKRQCAQYLIDACQHLIAAKPESLKFCKVVCMIAQPDMFSSEICLYLDEDYFNSHTLSGDRYDEQYILPKDKSLVQAWGLKLPENMCERGIHICYIDPENEEDNYIADWWYFFEV